MGAEAGGALVTRQHFDAEMGRLIVLRGWPDDIEGYWLPLCELPADVFTAAVDHALKTRTWFPVPAELRMDCDAATIARRATASIAPVPQVSELSEPRVLEIPNPFGGEPLRLKITREWRHDCDVCRDSGWAERTCQAHECGRRLEHRPHPFVERCACIEWNPTIRRQREAMMKFAKTPEKVA